jgi:hypothetical protein
MERRLVRRPAGRRGGRWPPAVVALVLGALAAAGCGERAVSDSYAFNPDIGTFERHRFAAMAVRGVWFSAATPPSTANPDLPPETRWPPQQIFERGRDATVQLVIGLVGGEARRVEGTIQHDAGVPRQFTGHVASAARPGAMHVHTRAWPIESLAPGRYTVDLTVDFRVAGTYVFEVR